MKQVPFINRKNELEKAKEIVREWDTLRIMCIEASGGIGKTRLLHEIHELYSNIDITIDGSEKKDITIAVMHELTASEWTEQFVLGVRSMGDELGVNLIETDAGFDLDQMAFDLDNVISRSPDAIVINLGTSEKLRPGIERATRKGIKVITWENYLHIDGLTARVEQNNYEGSHLSLEKLAEAIKFQGKVAAVWDGEKPTLRRRRSILDNILQKYPEIRLVAEFGQTSANMADYTYSKTKDLLKEHPDLKAIWTTWDDYAKGVTRALMEEGRNDVLVFSFDVCPSDIDLIVQPNSPWIATAAIDAKEAGRVLIRLATLAAYEVEIKRHYSLPMTLITQETLRQLIEPDLGKLSLAKDEIGWTPWLRSLSARVRLGEKGYLRITDVIDFDDYKFHNSQGLGYEIAKIDEQRFEPYRRRLLDLRKMEKAGFSSHRLLQERDATIQDFVDCFNSVSTQQRVVLFMDTTDALGGITDVLDFIVEIVPRLKNCVLLIAGRNAGQIGGLLQTRLNGRIDIINLKPLGEQASRSYLKKKQTLSHINLEPELEQKLLSLSEGRPILIDLAVEWRARQIPLEWLVQSSLEEIISVSDDQRSLRQQEFEYQLVHHIAETRQLLDWLILVMSRIYPLNVQTIIELLSLDNEQAEQLLEEARTYVFVKELPDGRISLHDEMRRMINEYVWPEVDPDGDRQRRDSMLAAEYFKREAQLLAERVDDLLSEVQKAQQREDVQAELNTLVTREALQYELWGLKFQQLKHSLFARTFEGVKTFATLFDEATQAYRFSNRVHLLELVAPYISRLSSEQKYEVDIRQAKYLLDSGQYSEAKGLLEEILNRTGLRSEQEIDTCIQMANVVIRLGEFQEGIEFFQQAVNISQRSELQEWLAKAENGLGWAYRLTADRESAREHYEIALSLARELDLKPQQALLYSNLGFLYAYIPTQRNKALSYCKASLALQKELDDKRRMGSSLSALGCVTFMDGQFDEALSYFQQSLDIFEPADDREWLSTVYSWRGVVYISKHNLDLAEKDLLRALEMDIEKDKALHQSRLALIYMIQNKLDKAQETVDECRQLALELPDVLYQLISIRDMARLARHKGEHERLEEFEQLLDDYREKWGPPQDRRSEGMLYLNLGSLALGQSKFSKAIEYYKLGLEPLAELGRYGGDTLEAHIQRLENSFVNELHLKPAQIKDIGRQLLAFWQEKGLDIDYPDVRILFSRWTKWEEA